MTELVILIVDDEPKVAEVLRTMLSKKLKIKEKFSIYTVNSVQEAIVAVDAYCPDLVFLDIQMPDENGLVFLDHYKTYDFEVVFTTAYEQYALEVLNNYPCLHYLLKPISLVDLQEVYDKFLAKEGHRDFIRVVRSNQKRYVVNVKDIVYCKASDNYCEIYLKDQKHLVSRTLGLVSEKLQHNFFHRVTRSYLVNINHVDYIEQKTNQVFFKEPIVINNEIIENEIIVSANKMKDLKMFNL
ncbi:MAG: LytTR family DNA-binding domain-containing protein [Flavobacteriaceae bacterium]|jgi:two-component system LytT family response regulator|nr:LytTR family DNA-binding domain-containing protein [Flavobacteriaceae bacterium]